MSSSLPYPSLNEERSRRRRGGRGFYRDRDLPYRSESGAEKRKRKRRPRDQKAAALGRLLSQAALDFPEFKERINQLRHHVLVQLRSPEWKAREVLSCLSSEPLSIEEVVEETWLNQTSVEETLQGLEADRLVEKCNRNGDRVVIRRHGRPTEKIYWRRRDNRKSI